ncbi:uncharacterized protein LOC143240772 isoform X1 [Tachypleus tridentatus]|uniref:uncharacterized protein LOC143240772 isoform X1 n=2 Tax=Tachypleus tridentatus TaxID=6853 RepID=UPI003FD6B529
MAKTECIFDGLKLNCSGIIYVEEELPLSYKDETFWIYIGVYVALVLVAGLMSGLTMGLLSLDITSLRVLEREGKPHEKKYAQIIIPLVEKHHLLLVTLIFGNAAAVETMPLFLDRVSNPITAVVVSVTAVLIFGEVVPQALCTRFGLAIGATLSPLVYFLMVIFLPVAFPIAKLLDCMLGEEQGTFYRRAELKALVDIHGPQPVKQETSRIEDPLTLDEVIIIQGALSMRDKTVQDAMVPIEKVFMMSCDTVLNEAAMMKIVWAGHSRIPIYENSVQNIVGILLVKTLIRLNPYQGVTIQQLMGSKCVRHVHRVSEAMPLFDLLNVFQTGRCHLSIVHASSGSPEKYQEDFSKKTYSFTDTIVGIITLENVIEELIQEEILDEKDITEAHLRATMAKARFARSLSFATFSKAENLPNTMKLERSILEQKSSLVGVKSTAAILTTISPKYGLMRTAERVPNSDDTTDPRANLLQPESFHNSSSNSE